MNGGLYDWSQRAKETNRYSYMYFCARISHGVRCYEDFAAYVGRTMRLRLEEEPILRKL